MINTESPLEIISTTDLTTYLALTGTPAPTDALLNQIVQLSNGVVYDAWPDASPTVNPIPLGVTAIALEVAARPCRNPKGLESWTVAVDDGSRTERLAAAGASRAGIYLTPEELAELRGETKPRRRRRSGYGTIRIRVP